MNDFSLEETRIIFDINKIGVGDVIEFESIEIITCPYVGESEKIRRLAGVITSVDSDTIQLLTGKRDYFRLHFVTTTINASDNIDMRLVYRNPQNLK